MALNVRNVAVAALVEKYRDKVGIGCVYLTTKHDRMELATSFHSESTAHPNDIDIS